jgi:hypothetical protein
MSDMKSCGSKAQVWHGNAKKTTGGLTKRDLMKNKHGRIVSKRKHNLGKKSIKRLRKLGYKAKKGEFKLFSKTRKSRGGNPDAVTDAGQNLFATGGNIGNEIFGQ